MISWLFAHGHAADLVLAVLALEFIWLARRGWRADAAALRLLPGACMILALRAALVGAAWPWIALPLAVSFPIHLADVGFSRRRRG